MQLVYRRSKVTLYTDIIWLQGDPKLQATKFSS